MSQSSETHKEFVPPTPAALMARYLQRQTEAHAVGLANVDLAGEVQPYEAGPVQPIDSKPAWEEAAAVVRCLAADRDQTWKAPPGWPNLVAAYEPVYSLAFALGNFPQLVRNLYPLLQTADLRELHSTGESGPFHVPGLMDWAGRLMNRKKFPELLLALGTLRLAKHYEMADRLIEECEGAVPADLRALWDNEKAALAWHRGRINEAQSQWQSMPESVPVLFNRGVAAMFLNRFAEARGCFAPVVDELPDTGAWHHLARLYLTLVERRLSRTDI